MSAHEIALRVGKCAGYRSSIENARQNFDSLRSEPLGPQLPVCPAGVHSLGLIMRGSRTISFRFPVCHLLVLLLLVVWMPAANAAKSYSSGSHSFSSSRSSSSGHSSSSGRSYSSGSSSSGSHSYSSGRSYSSGSGRTYSSKSSHSLSPESGSGRSYSSGSGGGKSFFRRMLEDKSEPANKSPGAASGSAFSFDTGAARAQKEAASKREFSKWKQSSETPPPRTGGGFDGTPRRPADYSPAPRTPPLFVPTPQVYTTRRVRIEHVFAPYYSRPVVVYRDPYSSFFWWWLLDRSLDERAYWAYHHRYDMDAARYQTLLATDTNLEARVRQLEAQQVAVNPKYVPSGLDPDLMYNDRYVHRVYSNRPTAAGRLCFWLILVPAVAATGAFLVWLVFVKRWQTA
jgi:hypothetical protein